MKHFSEIWSNSRHTVWSGCATLLLLVQSPTNEVVTYPQFFWLVILSHNFKVVIFWNFLKLIFLKCHYCWHSQNPFFFNFKPEQDWLSPLIRTAKSWLNFWFPLWFIGMLPKYSAASMSIQVSCVCGRVRFGLSVTSWLGRACSSANKPE